MSNKRCLERKLSLMFKKKSVSRGDGALKDDTQIRSLQEFSSFCSTISPERQHYEIDLARKCSQAEEKEIEVPGICEVCGKPTLFHLDFLYSDGITPNFREQLVCPMCGLNNRQRYMVSIVLNTYAPGQKVYMYEQITEVFKVLRSRLGARNVTGSEYIADGLKSGTKVKGILHEDAENLSFADASFDTIISCDVFEHVNSYEKCFAEAARVLKPGGKLYVSIPFYADRQENHRRAGFEGKRLVHYDTPVYHGNPMKDEGSLVFWDYGWDLLDDLKCAGFRDAFMAPYYSEKYGYLGGIPFLFIIQK